jgi:hypothetical protein
MKTEQKLIEVLNKESIKFNSKNGYNLSRVFEILKENGISTKTKYKLPLLDTIGRVHFEQMQYSVK